MSDDQNPWQRKSDQEPPDLFKIFKDAFKKKGGSEGGSGSGSGDEIASVWIWVIVGFIVVIWALSGIFIVKQAEQAVVLKFGKFVQTVGPGPHWLPPFIESEQKVNIQEINNLQYTSEMLTQDENIIDIQLAVHYRVDNPEDFLFKVTNPVQTLQEATSSALRAVVGQMSLDAILTTGRAELRDKVTTLLKATLAPYQTGLQITDVRLQWAKPPEAVTEAFNDAIKAREDEQSSKYQGEAYESKVSEEVKGQVQKILQSAEAYKEQIVLKAQGDVSRYKAVLRPYLQSPVVTRERMYLDTVQDVLSHTNNVIVDSGAHNVLYLPLDQMITNHLKATNGSQLQASANRMAQAPAKDTLPTSTNRLYGLPRPSYATNGGARS